MGDATEEPYENVKDLTALDDYLTLQGVEHWEDLPGNRPVRQRKANRRVGRPRLAREELNFAATRSSRAFTRR